MLQDAAKLDREPIPLGELILGTECGGSDYTSGLASNPAVGVASDMLVFEGGTVILSETPEIIGAETPARKKGENPGCGKNRFWRRKTGGRKRQIAGGQNIRDRNSSPGNIAGGITTLEEKSLGCIYKAGTSTIEECITYGSRPTGKGLVYMDTPAHDIEQLTGMVAGGSQIVVFTTGRGVRRAPPSRPLSRLQATGVPFST